MLSILIPVYNFDVQPLVQKLHQQASLLSIAFEIVCVDDGSQLHFKQENRKLEALTNIRYIEAEENMGRSKIRNYLSQVASYEYLLYMDCDSMPVDDQYIQNYVENLAPNQLLYGGRVYAPQAPQVQNLYFHWYYGGQREVTASEERQELPYKSFMTNNFLIPKTIFQQIYFDEQLTQYGHEDTLFGIELRKRKIKILHLDNPLEHIGLESVEIFIGKTEKAIQNLHTLSLQYDLGKDIRLLKAYEKVKAWKIHYFFWLGYKLFRKILIRNFKAKHPRLRWFDLYKLGYLIDWGFKHKL
ncbi:MAG: glycosyltransferase family 2 protein [Aureispira sp.]|nr:glycosyltransferase family 2 protein [Aureispira sp.]